MKPTETIEIPPLLQSKLEEFRSRLWSVKIGEGALAGIAGLIFSFLVVFLLDRFIDTPAWMRWLILVFGFAVPAVGIPIRYHHWVWQKRSLGQIARVLRRRYPRLGDELLGIVDLARESNGNQSRALVSAAMTQVSEKVKDRDFTDAVPENHYRRWMWLSVGLGAVTLLVIGVVSPAAQSSVARWMTPWRLIERYTFAKLRPVQTEIVVPYAERFDLSTALKDSTEWKPETGSMRLPGRTRLVTERQRDESYEFDVPPQKETAALKLRVGDARKKIVVKPVVRPELQDLSAKVRLPDYLLYQRDPIIPVRGGTIDLLEGASASFIGTASRDLAKASVNQVPTAISGNSFSTRPESVEGASKLVFEWEDANGLSAKKPFELRVNAIEDSAPDIFARKLSSEMVVLEDELISFEINSSDDFGIREIGLEWQGLMDPVNNPVPAIGGKIVAPGSAETRELESRGTFSASRYHIKPQTLQIRAYAEDFHPNRERAYSTAFLVHIMNPSDHANFLTREFGKWFNRAREVYERERQLHETNRELRALSAEELDRPENRRKLERQASAETSNSRRLEALTNSGRDLIRQASKNDEFEADRLEKWAEMMRTLEEISKDKMPSVADLLKKASQAVGMQPQGKEKPETQEKPPQDSGSESAPNVGNHHNDPPKTDGDETKAENDKEKANQPPNGPGISDTESGFDEENPKKTGSGEQPQNQGSGGIGLPVTTLKGKAGEEGEKNAGESSPAKENLDEAIKEQQELLASFSKVANELQEILSSLEASTFVKRLKAASRRQLDIAKNLNDIVPSGFGVTPGHTSPQAQEIAGETLQAQNEESENLYNIQTDLDAYYQRKQDNIYKNVLEQMRETSVVTKLKRVGRDAVSNLNGRSIAAAEYWSDTLDRWAEELVSASQGQQKGEGNQKKGKGLPPEIVLEIMKAARSQMDLREETRELEVVKPSLNPDNYGNDARVLEISQSSIRQRVDDIVVDLLDIENGSQEYDRELKLLNFVSDVMRQARGILARPDTGPEVIAAQTEAIELLLQSKRQPPQNGGGGGGGSPGGGSSSGDNGGALSDIEVRPGSESGAVKGSSSKRAVGQSTGKSGREFPEEFRNGLDSYFNALENIR